MKDALKTGEPLPLCHPRLAEKGEQPPKLRVGSWHLRQADTCSASRPCRAVPGRTRSACGFSPPAGSRALVARTTSSAWEHSRSSSSIRVLACDRRSSRSSSPSVAFMGSTMIGSMPPRPYWRASPINNFAACSRSPARKTASRRQLRLQNRDDLALRQLTGEPAPCGAVVLHRFLPRVEKQKAAAPPPASGFRPRGRSPRRRLGLLRAILDEQQRPQGQRRGQEDGRVTAPRVHGWPN